MDVLKRGGHTLPTEPWGIIVWSKPQMRYVNTIQANKTKKKPMTEKIEQTELVTKISD